MDAAYMMSFICCGGAVTQLNVMDLTVVLFAVPSVNFQLEMKDTGFFLYQYQYQYKEERKNLILM